MPRTTLASDGADGALLAQDSATLYPEGDGFFGRRAKKTRAKLLASCAATLRKALAPEEPVRYVANACRYFAAEYFLSGHAARYHNLVALVVTDRRLLLLQLSGRGKPGDLKNQIPLAEIRRAAGTALSGWRLELADGRKEAFVQLSRKDRQRLVPLLAAGRGEGAAAAVQAVAGHRSLVHLCPACVQPVEGAVGATLVCPHPLCRVPFRDPRRAARLSALVPGLGDLYLRHHLFGSLEFLGSMLALGVGLAFGLVALGSAGHAKLPEAMGLLALTVVLPRVIDFFVTRHMGGKGIVPLALAATPGAQADDLPSFPRWSLLLFAAGIAITIAVAGSAAEDFRRDAAVREAEQAAVGD